MYEKFNQKILQARGDMIVASIDAIKNKKISKLYSVNKSYPRIFMFRPGSSTIFQEYKNKDNHIGVKDLLKWVYENVPVERTEELNFLENEYRSNLQMEAEEVIKLDFQIAKKELEYIVLKYEELQESFLIEKENFMKRLYNGTDSDLNKVNLELNATESNFTITSNNTWIEDAKDMIDYVSTYKISLFDLVLFILIILILIAAVMTLRKILKKNAVKIV